MSGRSAPTRVVESKQVATGATVERSDLANFAQDQGVLGRFPSRRSSSSRSSRAGAHRLSYMLGEARTLRGPGAFHGWANSR